MKKLFTLASLLVLASLVLSACGGSAPKADNLLDDIKNRGYILISTDPNYAPQSSLNTEGSRPADTKCPKDALTTSEMQGFDVDVAIAVGKGLGVETCFATPGWDTLTAGSWADKWDMSVGSMTITTDRQKVLDFSVPYYYTPAVVAVLADSKFKSLDDLAGQAICAGLSTTYETWLSGGDLGLPESSIYAKPPAGITVVPLESDQECAQALKAGRTDFAAYSTSVTVVNANIAEGIPVKQLGGAVYSEDLAAAFDKTSTLSTATLIKEVNKLFTAMHSDGRLTELSVKWFEADLTKVPK